MLIGIAGKMGHGKTTLANVALGKFPNSTRVGFGDQVKEEIYTWLLSSEVNISKELLWGTQEDKLRVVAIPFAYIGAEKKEYNLLDFGEYDKESHSFLITIRSLLQWWGTDYRRRQDNKYWVKAWLNKINPFGTTLVDDVRFEDEAEFIRDLGGYLIKVDRPDIISKSGHASETALDNYPYFDFIISNDTSLEEYKQACAAILTKIEENYILFNQ